MSDIFPRWTNRLPGQIIFGLLLIGGVVTAGLNYYFTPKYTRVGYQPTQPVPFSHSIHVKQLGLDCRYCHDGVEKSWYSNVPAADTCMNCHSAVRADDPKLEPVRASYKDANKPVEWVQIHKLPDYVYFSHSVHVNRGVSCVECHGRVDEMDEVRHEKHFSMTFCLDCHRDLSDSRDYLAQGDSIIKELEKEITKINNNDEFDDKEKKGIIEAKTAKAKKDAGVHFDRSQDLANKRLRPLDKITNLAYDRSEDKDNKANFVKEWHVKTSENCSACHR
jgi:formate-dependent nitrite reductase cytochrome c552 subunit